MASLQLLYATKRVAGNGLTVSLDSKRPLLSQQCGPIWKLELCPDNVML